VVRVPEAAGSGLRGALLLVIIGFAARTMLDATVRDHIIQEHLLAMGALLGSIALAGTANRA